MSSSRKYIVGLIAVLSLVFKSSGQDADTLGTELGLVWFKNTTYKYQGYHLRYYSSRKLFKKKVRFRADLEGYRAFRIGDWGSQNFPFAEYSKLNVGADYLIEHKRTDKLTTYLLPHTAFSIIFDVSKINKVPTKGLFVAPRLGADYVMVLDKWRFMAQNTITIFLDGLWYELQPSVAFDVWKGINARVGMNTVFAVTYNGNASVGLYPSIGIHWYPGK